MSSRWYPLFNRGNPQLRIFLPNLWMKILPRENLKYPPNVVSFQVSPQMTRLDVKNYLNKIYKLPVLNVKTINVSGKTHPVRYSKSQELYKDDDQKMAIVTFAKEVNFEFPDITKNIEDTEDNKKMLDDIEESKKQFVKYAGTKSGTRKGAPPFFGL